MKAAIWILCLLAGGLAVNTFKDSSVAVIVAICGAAVCISVLLCRLWDKYKGAIKPEGDVPSGVDNICVKCGAVLSNTTDLCPSCGEAVKREPKAPSGGKSKPRVPKGRGVRTAPVSSKHGYLGALIAIIVFGIFVSIFVMSIFFIKDVFGFISRRFDEFPREPDASYSDSSQTSSDILSFMNKTCISISCDNEITGDFNYCDEHRCTVSGCDREKSDNSNYCSLHECASLDCHNLRVNGGMYCDGHTCGEESCLYLKAAGSDFCTTHKCMTLDCKNGRKSGSFYCKEHNCEASGCTSEKTAPSKFCLMHKCMESGCNYKRVDGFFCSKHIKNSGE